MSSSSNGLKSGGLTIAFSKLSKPNEDQLEMNSINSTILLNPSAIKNNHPVINQLYTPVISQRSDAIDLNSISIPTFPNNINQLLLANSLQSLQSLQPNKYHVRGSLHTGGSVKNRTNDLNRTLLNSQQQSVINFTGSVSSNSASTSTSSSNSYMSNNMRLASELTPTITSVNKSAASPSSSNSEINSISLSNKQSNQQIKRSRLAASTGKSFVYSDKSAVDSVKKLDKIILNHNKNLQEIIKHKNQLIKTITAKQSKQTNSSSDLIQQSSQFSLNSLNNINHQLNFHNSHLNSLNHLNNHIQTAHQLNHSINQQMNSQHNNQSNHHNHHSNHHSNHISSNYQFNQLNLIFNSSTNNKSNKHQLGKHQFNHLNHQSIKQSNVNKRLCWKNETTIDLLNNSLNALNKAINEEAELNKQIANQKRLLSQSQQMALPNRSIEKSQNNKSINSNNHNSHVNHNQNSHHNNSNGNKTLGQSFDLNELIITNEVLISNEFGSSSIINSFNRASHSYDTFIKQSNLEIDDGLMADSSYLANHESSIRLNSSISSPTVSPPARIPQPNRPIVSKLDERELRKKKLNDEPIESQVFYYDDNGDIYELDMNECSGDEISDCENEDEYKYRLKAYSIIFNASRSSPNLTNEKVDFLRSIGLITDEHKRRLEFDKLVKSKRTLKEINNTTNSSNKQPAVKRKRTLRKQSSEQSTVEQTVEITTDPAPDESICNLVKSNKKATQSPLGDKMEIFNKFVQGINTRKVEFNHLEPSKVQPDQVRDSSNPAKQCFMNQIGLELENDVENIKSRELNWEGCLEDRERRKIFDTCLENLTDNLEPLTKQNWLANLNERTLNAMNNKKAIDSQTQTTQLTRQLLNHNLNQLHSNLTANAASISKKAVENADLSGLKECFQASKSSSRSSANSGEHINKNTSSFRNSNKNNSTQIKSTGKNLVKSSSNLLISNQEDTQDSVMNKQIENCHSDVSFKWPGVDAIIQSYHDYNKQMQSEKVIWSKRNHTACSIEQELMEQKEVLLTKRESLINDIKDVKDDYHQLSLAIESLVSWLKSIK